MNAAGAPLAGLRILDLTRLLPGPAATLHLADFGADVIKVEDTGAGDYMRDFAPLLPNAEGVRVNPAFEASNRGKRSVAIDLKQPRGRDLLLALSTSADALIESFRPGVMARLGLGWDTLHARNPRLVLCSISGYGQTGPWSDRAGHDINYIATSGVLDQIRADGHPAIPNLQLGDLLGGALAALSSLLIALLAAQRTGQGRWIDVAMSEALLVHHYFHTRNWTPGEIPVAGSTSADRWRRLLPCLRNRGRSPPRRRRARAKFWEAFCDAVGLPELRTCHWARGEMPGSAAARATIERVCWLHPPAHAGE
jgi:crotonobetainyl-CoA:carnitine CoA-transferase CaiB-like acyl-CoA transferase